MTGANNKPGKYSLATLVGQMRGGLIDNNPTLVQLLGTCPTLATTTSLANAVGMGIAATAVLVFSNMFISMLRKLIPPQVRIAAYIVIISGFVSAVELLIKAYLPELDASLGVFIPLIVVNCIILARAEAFASKNQVLPSIVDGIAMGLGFTLALTLISTVREVIGAGTLLGYPLFGGAVPPVTMFIMPPGAFITMGCIIAGVNKLLSIAERRKKKLADKTLADEIAEDAKVGGGPAPHASDLEFVSEAAENADGEKADTGENAGDTAGSGEDNG
jgi:electron transport complex protein RnfE